jgi:hypothetical protein
MNIEELSKAQLILLTILVNFVMSVATSIMTVSLLDQAPQVVTQAINRVVDRTVERVVQAVPAVAPSSPAPSNQELVMNAIASQAARTVGFYPARSGTSSPAIAVGTYLSKSRVVVTAARESLMRDMLIEFSGGKTALGTLVTAKNGIAIYGFATNAALPEAPATSLVITKDLRLGQTVLAISADGSAATGIVAKVTDNAVNTTLPDIGLGSAVVDISGNLIGLSAGESGALIPSSVISQLLATPAAAR